MKKNTQWDSVGDSTPTEEGTKEHTKGAYQRSVPKERTHWNAPPGRITLALERSSGKDNPGTGTLLRER